ncbi:MAG: hypothetical protein K2I36_01665 [Ureaplasma sp.]|nr:hypothetical protein [Ureaplasma sp.]MDE7221863.1 hypothetical protein [Ureaplasma sp.]
METKFFTKNNKNELPKWNSNIPKSNSLYLFVSASKENPIMFLGSDYISNEVHNIFINYFENFNEKMQIDILKEKTKLLNNKYNPFGLYPKIKMDFLKRNDFVFGNDEKLNIFDFAAKMKWKENVIIFLQGLLNEK